MKFLKENSYNVVRLMINQFGMMIFGLVLSFATASMQGAFSDDLFLFVSIFTVCFYMVLIYYMVWELGARDIIRVEAGRMKYDRFYGTKIALLANVPNLLIALIGFVGFLFGHSLADYDFGKVMYSISHVISGFIQAPYLGIIKRVFQALDLTNNYLADSLVYIFTTIPAILTTSFAYVLGCKNFRIFPQKNKKS